MFLDSPILDPLEPRELDRLLDRCVRRELATGEILCLAGDREPRLHVLEQGLLKLVARDGSGEETIVGLIVPGETVGELAAIDGVPQPVDVVAIDGSVVYGFDAELFIETVMRCPDAAVALNAQTAIRLRWAYSMMQERTTSEVSARLAGRLLDLADVLGRVEAGAVEFDLPMGQADLGRLAGMCRESTCKTLRSFRADGIVDYQDRKLRILRPDALERIRCAGRA